ncbi:hypothetical protein Droror1_Dr00000008 [Drosera rotundifolia]
MRSKISFLFLQLVHGEEIWGWAFCKLDVGLKAVLFVAVSVRDLVGVLGLEPLDFEADLVKQLGFLETSNADSLIQTVDLDDDFGDVFEAIEVVR